jgi:inosine/xanthosine triphosphate pyrophosphatase family protein
VFLLPDGRTLAELLDEEKNIMSHRAAAMADILKMRPEVLRVHAAAAMAPR